MILEPAHASLLELCARLLVQELDEETIEALRHVEIAPLLEQLEPGVTAYLDSCSHNAVRHEELAAEYCRLFLMSKATSPMLSVWVGADQEKMGAQLAARSRGWQETLGIELAEGPWGNLPRDHLAIALGVLAVALVRTTEDPSAVRLREELQREILAPAVPRFAEAVLDHSDNPAYRAAVKLIRELTT